MFNSFAHYSEHQEKKKKKVKQQDSTKKHFFFPAIVLIITFKYCISKQVSLVSYIQLLELPQLLNGKNEFQCNTNSLIQQRLDDHKMVCLFSLCTSLYFPYFFMHLFPFCHDSFIPTTLAFHSSPYRAFYRLLPQSSQKKTGNIRQSYSHYYFSSKFNHLQKQFANKAHTLCI